jgi:hypothetical protein
LGAVTVVAPLQVSKPSRLTSGLRVLTERVRRDALLTAGVSNPSRLTYWLYVLTVEVKRDALPATGVSKRSRLASGLKRLKSNTRVRITSKGQVTIPQDFLKGSCPMMFKLLLDVMDRFLNLRDTNCANHTVPYGTALLGVALSQALRARLRSHRPSGTIRNRL